MSYIKPKLRSSEKVDFVFRMLSSETGVPVEYCKQCNCNCHHCK